MFELIDTHSHLYDEAFAEDFDAVVSRAKEAGVTTCIMPGIDISSHGRMIEAAEKLPGFAYPCIGLHPTSVAENWQEELEFVKKHIGEREFSAIGEIGLDEYWSKEFVKEQMRVFEEQIALAAEHSLPVLIHVREATEDTFRALEDTRGIPVRGIFHAFTGSYETYCRLQTYGDFKFGIGGVVTYKNAGIAATVERMSPDDIVLETDCPWLTPVPFRGKRNESSYVRFVAEKVAALLGVTPEDVARTTTANAKKIFRNI